MPKAIIKPMKWHIAKIDSSVLTAHEIEKHSARVRALLDGGHKNIGLSITPKEYPYSKHLLLILRCARIVNQHGGRFAVIQSDNDFLETVKAANMHKEIKFVTSVEELIE
jgi:hypothetical protein